MAGFDDPGAKRGFWESCVCESIYIRSLRHSPMMPRCTLNRYFCHCEFRSSQDSRVKHIRNEQNLGPLRNYNKGITLSRGKYVWLISADDYLRRPYVLERYVELTEAHPSVGYTFCPGVAVKNGKEGGIWKGSEYGRHDCIIKGHVFLKTLLKGKQVLRANKCWPRQQWRAHSVTTPSACSRRTWSGPVNRSIWCGAATGIAGAYSPSFSMSDTLRNQWYATASMSLA
jgi:hypothetical protein